YELEEILQNSNSSVEISKIKEKIEKLEEKVVRETDLQYEDQVLKHKLIIAYASAK
ncbi:6214_t:CDS:2, partial [Gigaspora margarita]